MRKTEYFVIALLMASVASYADRVFAHHAMEYNELESYETGHRGDLLFHLHYDYYFMDIDDASLDRSDITFGFGYSITDRLMVDLSTNLVSINRAWVSEEYMYEHPGEFGLGSASSALYSRRSTSHGAIYRRHAVHPPAPSTTLTGEYVSATGPDPFLETVGLTVQYRVVTKVDLPVDIATSFSYEYALECARDVMGRGDAWYGTLILSRELPGDINVATNLTFGKYEEDDAISRWGAGVKRPLGAFLPGVEMGLESFGPFDKNEVYLMPGLFVPVGKHVALKGGVAFGFGDGGDYRSSVSMMVMF